MGLAVARAQNNGLTTYHDKLWGWSTVPNPGQWRIAPDGEVSAEFEAIDGSKKPYFLSNTFDLATYLTLLYRSVRP